MSKLKLSLLDNGLDYLETGVSHLESKQDDKLKYAIRDLFSGVSLVFKERLKNEGWYLMFDNVDKADERLLKSGNFKSVSIDDSVLRINSLDGDTISSEFVSTLNVLKEKRNKIEHYHVSDDINSLRSVCYKTLKFTLDFVTNELSIPSEEQGKIESLREKILKYSSYRKKRFKEIQPLLDNHQVIFTCPSCLNDAFPLEQELRKCYFCFHQEDNSETLAYEYRSNVLNISSYGIAKGRQDEVLEVCPECSSESLIFGYDGENHICFECAEVVSCTTYDSCTRCGQLMYSDNESMTCSMCWDDIMSKD